MVNRYQLGLSAAIHKGDLNIIRSYLFSNDIHITNFLERLNSLTYPDRKTISIVVTGKIKASATGTRWENRFQQVSENTITDGRIQETVKEHGAFWFMPTDDSPL
jgi:hypothetical protein